MELLSDLPVIVGFFSYSRDDDRDLNGGLSALRRVIQAELRSQLGRKDDTFQLWQDKVNIGVGTRWQEELTAAVDKAVFFISIVTPTSVASQHCKLEMDSFIAREKALGRRDLMFPLLCITVPELEDDTVAERHPVLRLINERQYVDWREYRFRDANSPELRAEIARFCQRIAQTLRRRAAVQVSRPVAPVQPTAAAPPGRYRPRIKTGYVLLALTLGVAGAGSFLAWDAWQSRTQEQARQDQAALELATREQARRDQATRDQVARNQAARDQAARDQAARDQAARDQAARDQATRDQAAREQATRDQATRDQAAREQATRDQATRDQAAREQATRDQAIRDQATRDQAARDQAALQARLRNVDALLGVGLTANTRRWTTLASSLPCYGTATTTYDVFYVDGYITWTSGGGDVDQEAVQAITDQTLITSTVSSAHRSGRAEVTGTSWEYRPVGDGLSVSRNGRFAFKLRRCD